MFLLRSLLRLSRLLWVVLFAALLGSSLWMEALHHHDDFSRDNPDCIFCHAAGGVSVVPQAASALTGLAVLAWVVAGTPVEPTFNSVLVLAHSPKTGPPPFPA